ncbi:thiamine phosphate synthase [Uliginosibacterium sp. H3]|uniref:Thiamine-phosphate synthase n=1 Tax=Uliginosibacterium silvisoli TaxID=3114758 RepID=A0ABU6JXE3_9RHOO|nr:thiamine phosphate synthase [Uliginosibacterium sp. H3]
MNAPIKRGLYLVTPDWDDTPRLIAATRAAVQAGAVCVQYRHKGGTTSQRMEQALALSVLLKQQGVTFIVNDDAALAAAVAADGVHVGRDDGNVAALRSKYGSKLIIGVSCYNDFALAQKAVAEGASYIAFGAMFASPTKPQAVAAPIELVSRAKAELEVPVACIGGITADNALPLVEAGADWLAVITDVYGAEDPGARAAQLAALYA